PRWYGTNEGRSPNGRFDRGNQIGTGNPNARRIHENRKAVLEAVAPQDVVAIILKQVDLAKDGDTLAARFVADYVLGKPVQAVSLENEGDGTTIIQVIRATPNHAANA